MKSLLAGISFMTRLPVGRFVPVDAADVAHSAGWFPVIGILLGAISSAAAALLRGHLPSPVVAVLLVVLDALLTGALHFDGLADTADGFGGGKDRDDVLRIMRDHAIGSYGGTALILVIGLKVLAYDSLLPRDDWFLALFLTPALGRWSILLLTSALPYARSTPSVVPDIGKRALLWGTFTIACAILAFRVWRSCAAAAAILIVTFGFGLYCRRRIGGITGDTLGASVQLTECAALLVFLWSAAEPYK